MVQLNGALVKSEERNRAILEIWRERKKARLEIWRERVIERLWN